MVKLGNRVRDMISGFEGIAVCRTEWLYGCTRIGIEPTELKDGKLASIEHFDEQRVELVTASKPPQSALSTARTGGPYDAPTRGR